ncbi:T9SS type A sorting domain-containing protein [Hymenobacter busanensis]|uniref:T9SS type A sorting domain-containing protein n=1 Tax=Hymenobacter busanensis TaxID=2607656 RepID=A0A7L4ZXI5_9BACT|nr:zinc-dependent metalloprotease [Hymenobacter busanensis]KAA9333340.1 T9SS type A sorting domain-containing protein [Hymenobacter busanensis]QHJ07981.1 T9SS type A sorting domain-containing protein [Hymenobacter busanensis]
MRAFRWLSLILVLSVMAQVGRGQAALPTLLPCGTASPTAAHLQELRQRVLPFEQQRQGARPSAVITYVPIKIHVIRRSDGTGGLDEMQIYKGLAATNEQFVLANMQFYVAGQLNYINNTAYYDFDSQNEPALSQVHDVPGVLNIYFVKTATLRGGAVGGYASSQGRMFIIYSHANLDRTFSHELGHNFGLIHTFDASNSPNIAERELVARTNCATTGDWVCDTPADPSERPGASYYECEYTGTITDAQGNSYSPPVRNAMAFNFCGNQFTPGQLARMDSWRQLNWNNLAWSGSQAAAPSALGISVVSVGAAQFQQVRLQWQDNATDELGYFIERATPGNEFAAVGVVGANQTTFVDAGAPARQPLFYRVKPINAVAGFSNITSIFSGLSYALPLYVNKDCTPGSTYYQDADYLEEVRLSQGSTPLITSLNIPCGPYNAFASSIVPLTAGTSYTVSCKAKIQNNAYYNQQYVGIWIDFNRDGVFDDGSERVVRMLSATPAATLPVTQTFLLTIPAGVSNGVTRMRIRSLRRDADGNVWDAAARAWGGAVEDYAVQIQGGVSATAGAAAPAALQVYPNPASRRLRVELANGKTWQHVVARNLQGQVMEQWLPAKQAPEGLDVEKLPAGVYVLEVHTPQGMAYRRFVKQ